MEQRKETEGGFMHSKNEIFLPNIFKSQKKQQQDNHTVRCDKPCDRRLLSLWQTNLFSKGLIYVTLLMDILTALQLIHVHSTWRLIPYETALLYIHHEHETKHFTSVMLKHTSKESFNKLTPVSLHFNPVDNIKPLSER